MKTSLCCCCSRSNYSLFGIYFFFWDSFHDGLVGFTKGISGLLLQILKMLELGGVSLGPKSPSWFSRHQQEKGRWGRGLDVGGWLWTPVPRQGLEPLLTAPQEQVPSWVRLSVGPHCHPPFFEHNGLFLRNSWGVLHTLWERGTQPSLRPPGDRNVWPMEMTAKVLNGKVITYFTGQLPPYLGRRPRSNSRSPSIPPGRHWDEHPKYQSYRKD